MNDTEARRRAHAATPAPVREAPPDGAGKCKVCGRMMRLSPKSGGVLKHNAPGSGRCEGTMHFPSGVECDCPDCGGHENGSCDHCPCARLPPVAAIPAEPRGPRVPQDPVTDALDAAQPFAFLPQPEWTKLIALLQGRDARWRDLVRAATPAAPVAEPAKAEMSEADAFAALEAMPGFGLAPMSREAAPVAEKPTCGKPVTFFYERGPSSPPGNYQRPCEKPAGHERHCAILAEFGNHEVNGGSGTQHNGRDQQIECGHCDGTGTSTLDGHPVAAVPPSEIGTRQGTLHGRGEAAERNIRNAVAKWRDIGNRTEAGISWRDAESLLALLDGEREAVRRTRADALAQAAEACRKSVTERDKAASDYSRCGEVHDARRASGQAAGASIALGAIERLSTQPTDAKGEP